MRVWTVILVVLVLALAGCDTDRGGPAPLWFPYTMPVHDQLEEALPWHVVCGVMLKTMDGAQCREQVPSRLHPAPDRRVTMEGLCAGSLRQDVNGPAKHPRCPAYDNGSFVTMMTWPALCKVMPLATSCTPEALETAGEELVTWRELCQVIDSTEVPECQKPFSVEPPPRQWRGCSIKFRAGVIDVTGRADGSQTSLTVFTAGVDTTLSYARAMPEVLKTYLAQSYELPEQPCQ